MLGWLSSPKVMAVFQSTKVLAKVFSKNLNPIATLLLFLLLPIDTNGTLFKTNFTTNSITEISSTTPMPKVSNEEQYHRKIRDAQGISY